jgi:nucleoid-associated protein YgaU
LAQQIGPTHWPPPKRGVAAACGPAEDTRASGSATVLRSNSAIVLDHQEKTMGLMSFMKSAGEKLFGIGEAKAATVAVAAAPTPENVAALSDAAGQAITSYITAQGIDASALDVGFDAPSGTVTVSGNVPDQATKEKIALCCGNVSGVEAVNDMMTVDAPADESQYYTVVSGDSLSKIAKKFYDDAMEYPAIFEANKPMLSHPDKIYPGQLLRIPPQE